MWPVQPRTLGAGWWVQAYSSQAVLPLTCHQCSIHCESSSLAQRASYLFFIQDQIKEEKVLSLFLQTQRE